MALVSQSHSGRYLYWDAWSIQQSLHERRSEREPRSIRPYSSVIAKTLNESWSVVAADLLAVEVGGSL